jgi:aspartyl-tRNA(Asn)/glutamyl-tRNA(Gln) amidotransferase subunit C
MQINEKTLEKLLHMTHLQLSPQQRESSRKDLSNILSWINKLSEINTNDIKPLVNMSDQVNRFRKDIPEEPLTHSEATSNAPEAVSDYFNVPAIKE